MNKRTFLLGIPIDALTIDEFADCIIEKIKMKEHTFVASISMNMMNNVKNNKCLESIIKKAELARCDAMGIKWANAIHNKLKIPHRVNAMDLIDPVFKRIEVNKYKVFIIGHEDSTLAAFKKVVLQKYPDLRITGLHNGFFDHFGKESEIVVSKIIEANPDLLLVGMGMPKQELWINSIRDKVPPMVMMPVGAMYKWYSGIQTRGPAILYRNGFEWLCQLAQSPKRLAKRFLVGHPVFWSRVIIERIRMAINPNFSR